MLYKIVSDVKTEKYYLVLGGVMGLLIPLFVDLDYVSDVPVITNVARSLNNSEVLIAVGKSYYFVLGHFLSRIEEKVSKKIVVISALFWGVAWLLSGTYVGYIYLNNEGIRESNIVDKIVAAYRYGRYYGGYVAPTLILYSISLFLLFRVVLINIEFNSCAKRMISYIGKRCSWIFIIHGIVISFFKPIIPHIMLEYPILSVCIDSTVYFLISLMIIVMFECVKNYLYRFKDML